MRRSNSRRFRRVATEAVVVKTLQSAASSAKSVLSSKSGVTNPTEMSEEKNSRKAAIKGIFGEKELTVRASHVCACDVLSCVTTYVYVQSLPPILTKLVNIMAKHFHAVWAVGKATSGWRYGEERSDENLIHPLLKSFSELSEDAQTDNRMAALKQIKLIRAVGYTIMMPETEESFSLDQVKTWVSLGSLGMADGDVADLMLIQALSRDKIDTSDVVLDDSHFQLVELCARNSHEEWSLQQMQRGYVYGPGPKVRVSAGKCTGGRCGCSRHVVQVSTPRDGDGPAVQKTNNLLVPFELLPPDYQSSNRSAAEEMVKLLVKLGADVVPEVSGARRVAQNMEQLRNVQVLLTLRSVVVANAHHLPCRPGGSHS